MRVHYDAEKDITVIQIKPHKDSPFIDSHICLKGHFEKDGSINRDILPNSLQISESRLGFKIFDRLGIHVAQRVEWLREVPLSRSYMAMMPPLKEVSNCYRIGQSEYLPITKRSFTESGHFDLLTLRGEDGFTFEMGVKRYLSEKGINTCMITDNGGDAYHKMYFVLTHSGQAKRGDIWETETVYCIRRERADVTGS